MKSHLEIHSHCASLNYNLIASEIFRVWRKCCPLQTLERSPLPNLQTDGNYCIGFSLGSGAIGKAIFDREPVVTGNANRAVDNSVLIIGVHRTIAGISTACELPTKAALELSEDVKGSIQSLKASGLTHSLQICVKLNGAEVQGQFVAQGPRQTQNLGVPWLKTADL